eukprot:UN22574
MSMLGLSKRSKILTSRNLYMTKNFRSILIFHDFETSFYRKICIYLIYQKNILFSSKWCMNLNLLKFLSLTSSYF